MFTQNSITMKYSFLLLFFLITLSLYSQQQEGLNIGVRTGWAKSQVGGLTDNIIPDFYSDTTFTTKDSTINGFVGGIQFSYKWEKMALLVEAGYARRGGILKYKERGSNPLTYDVAFKYDYLDFSVATKYYLLQVLGIEEGFLRGINLLGGINFGVNAGTNQVEYNSNDTNKEIDRLVERNLETSLEGKLNFAAIGGLGIEIPLEGKNRTNDHALSIDFRLRYGLSDIIETRPNDFFIIPGNNLARPIWKNFDLTVTYIFGTGDTFN